jgi:hypothetical protein
LGSKKKLSEIDSIKVRREVAYHKPKDAKRLKLMWIARSAFFTHEAAFGNYSDREKGHNNQESNDQ